VREVYFICSRTLLFSVYDGDHYCYEKIYFLCYEVIGFLTKLFFRWKAASFNLTFFDFSENWHNLSFFCKKQTSIFYSGKKASHKKNYRLTNFSIFHDFSFLCFLAWWIKNGCLFFAKNSDYANFQRNYFWKFLKFQIKKNL
jgi:hypothetical protein